MLEAAGPLELAGAKLELDAMNWIMMVPWTPTAKRFQGIALLR